MVDASGKQFEMALRASRIEEIDIRNEQKKEKTKMGSRPARDQESDLLFWDCDLLIIPRTNGPAASMLLRGVWNVVASVKEPAINKVPAATEISTMHTDLYLVFTTLIKAKMIQQILGRRNVGFIIVCPKQLRQSNNGGYSVADHNNVTPIIFSTAVLDALEMQPRWRKSSNIAAFQEIMLTPA